MPKFHHLYHLGQEALYTNPRLGWTYSKEDWMSHIQRVGQAYRHGVAMSARAGPMMRAWAVGQAVSLKYPPCADKTLTTTTTVDITRLQC